MEFESERIEMALGAMRAVGPRDLRAYLSKPGPDVDTIAPAEIDSLIGKLLDPDPNAPSRLAFSTLLHSWDNAKSVPWTAGTQRNTAQRRQQIHKLLKSDGELENRIDSVLPFFQLEEPLIVAQEHKDWYVPAAGVRDYYWSEYVRYLRDQRGWNDASVLSLDNSTRAIVECFSNPEASQAYASRGLVMGYVQSGKTANFIGVAARAADAGYRLIIVLAGTWNILRNQTQRRFDKELLGKELLSNDESYIRDPPPDWPEFMEHGGDPSELGQFTWQRLTRPDIDFRGLKSSIDSLEFERVNKAAPIYDPSNLHGLPVKLLVIKKNWAILGRLAGDLNLLRTRLNDLPTLIIDDESDQAGLNTAQKKNADSGKKKRSETNDRIVELLNLFPRGQYIGYTATPYANALVDPDDPEDLFPKDFIVSLERPAGYMGVSDFFDPDTDYDDLSHDDYSLPEIAHIRRVENPVGSDDEDLKTALRSYVLAGAVKLFRLSADPGRYKAEHIKHHTMLVHTSSLTGEHQSVTTRIKSLWDQCAFNSPGALGELKHLWENDFRKVSEALGTEVMPQAFSELIPDLSEAIKRIERGGQPFLVVNSDSPDAPDFSRTSVWKIIIGGNKLSRGYTVEGLTVSFYRRVSGTADTLMQMGRWFGFRPGYRDLVRVFLGVKEGRKQDVDLVAQFKEVCRMEEHFRGELKRYVRRTGAQKITPREIPPMISVSGSLPPTARNKMFNATLLSKNFGGQWAQPTQAPAEMPAIQANLKATSALLASATSPRMLTLGGKFEGRGHIEFSAAVFNATSSGLVRFLGSYEWLETRFKHGERPADTGLQIEFLEKQKHGIESWLVIAPQRNKSFGDPLRLPGTDLNLNTKERNRIAGRGFGVYGEPRHREVCEYISCVFDGKPKLEVPNRETAPLRDRHRGALLLYPVREVESGPVSIGFEILFPANDLPYDLNFTVRRKGEGAQISAAGP